MKQTIDEIYNLLLEQKEVQNTLLDFALKKRETIISNDTDELPNIVRAEYLALSHMNKIEKQRLKVIDFFTDTLGKQAKDITIGDLLKYADDPQKQLLKSVHKELLEIMTQLKAQNDENRSLVEMQLEFTDMMLAAIAGSEDPLNNFYGVDGQSLDAEISRGRSIIDTEI